MCDQLVTPAAVISTISEMNTAGYTVTASDIEAGYELDPAVDDACLCAVDVEAVLDRAGVVFHYQPHGYTTITPTDPDDVAYDLANQARRR